MTAPLSEGRLAEIAAFEAAATPGPWTQDRGFSLSCPDPDDGLPLHLGYVNVAEEADVAFIAAARTAVPELLAEIARQRKVILRLTDGANSGVQRVRMYESASGAWRVRWMLDGRRKATTCGSEAEARDFAGRLQAESGAE